MNKVAIVDFGSARVKLTVAELKDGALHCKRYREELNTARLIPTSPTFGKEYRGRFLAAAERMRVLAQENDCDHIVGVGTEAFRSASDGDDAVRVLSRILPGFRVLSAQEEGLLLFCCVCSSAEEDCTCVVDVGGASVQIVWSDKGVNVISLPLGPGVLEGSFQAQPWAKDAEFQAIKEHVDNHLRTALPQSLRRSKVVFGSTCMAEFIHSAVQYFSINEAIRGNESHADLLAVLMIEIRALNGTDAASVYPQNPSFAMGADKVLLIVSRIASRVGATTAVPTDESISTAIAYQLLSPCTQTQRIVINAHRLS